MTNPFLPSDPTATSQEWPRTVAEAVDWLTRELSQAEKDEIAGLPESDLIGMFFGLGMRIRDKFGLWEGNHALLADSQRAKHAGCLGTPEDSPAIQPDDASMLIIRVLWLRLRH